MILIIGLIIGLILLKERFEPMTIKQIVDTYKDLAITNGFNYNVEPSLVLAIIKQESSGIPNAVGSSGEIGLCQITKYALQDFNEKTGNKYKLHELFEPEKNIEVASFYIHFTTNYFNSTTLGLQAYNAGIGKINSDNSISFNYASSVLNYQKEIKNILTKGI